MVDKKSVYLCPKLINKEKSSIYLLDSPILWHARLGHVNYKSFKNLSNLGYISKLNLKEIRKCEICIEAKLAKNSFHSDRGGEYESNDFSELCTKFGIIHQTIAPYTPQKIELLNGRTEL